jgi:hypothetical protein
VDSAIGRGTSFRIYLPCVHDSTLPIPPEPGPDSTLGGTETVLLVEDAPMVMRLAEMVLSRLGYTVLSAANAR